MLLCKVMGPNFRRWHFWKILDYVFSPIYGLKMFSNYLIFKSSSGYTLAYCSGGTPVPFTNLPTEQTKTWTLTETATTVKIECNGVEVATYILKSSCASPWGKDTAKIYFHPTHDTASDAFRAKPLAGKL